jgi:hypothetical protein
VQAIDINHAEFGLEEPSGAEALRALFDDVRSAASPEIADDVATVIGRSTPSRQIGISEDVNGPSRFDAAAIATRPASRRRTRTWWRIRRSVGIDLGDDSDTDLDPDDLRRSGEV